MEKIKLSSDKNIHEKLVGYGFRRYNRSKQNYFLTIPIYISNNIPVIEMQFIASPNEGYIVFDVIDLNTNSLYAAFYNRDHSSNQNIVLEKVICRINKELELMKIENIISDHMEV